MVEAMLLTGMGRCEVLGLRLSDVRLGEWRVLVAEGKGGHQRLIPVSRTFFAIIAAYLNHERPPDAATDRVFVVLKGPRRGQPLSAEGLDEVLTGARRRADLAHGTCYELRHTCLTRLRGGGHGHRGPPGSGRVRMSGRSSKLSRLVSSRRFRARRPSSRKPGSHGFPVCAC